jgi:YD repeat-containing protein
MSLKELLESMYGVLTVPESSVQVLVSKTIYALNTGRAVSITDPAGKETLTEYDNPGRVIRTIANYKPNETGTDKNVTVEYSYSKTGQVLTLTAVNSATGNQITQYEYDAFGRVVKEIYPDSENTVADCVIFGYNNAGELVWKQDQNGTRHEYYYDNFGRLLSDTALYFTLP